MKIYLLILPNHLSQLNNTQYTHPTDLEATVLYAAIWCLAVLIKRAQWEPVSHIHDTLVLQIAAHSMADQKLLCQYSTIWITTTHLHQAQMNLSKILQQKKFFPQVH